MYSFGLSRIDRYTAKSKTAVNQWGYEVTSDNLSYVRLATVFHASEPLLERSRDTGLDDIFSGRL